MKTATLLKTGILLTFAVLLAQTSHLPGQTTSSGTIQASNGTNLGNLKTPSGEPITVIRKLITKVAARIEEPSINNMTSHDGAGGIFNLGYAFIAVKAQIGNLEVKSATAVAWGGEFPLGAVNLGNDEYGLPQKGCQIGGWTLIYKTEHYYSGWPHYLYSSRDVLEVAPHSTYIILGITLHNLEKQENGDWMAQKVTIEANKEENSQWLKTNFSHHMEMIGSTTGTATTNNQSNSNTHFAGYCHCGQYHEDYAIPSENPFYRKTSETAHIYELLAGNSIAPEARDPYYINIGPNPVINTGITHYEHYSGDPGNGDPDAGTPAPVPGEYILYHGAGDSDANTIVWSLDKRKSQKISSENATIPAGEPFTPVYHETRGSGQRFFTSRYIINRIDDTWDYQYTDFDRPIPNLGSLMADDESSVPKVTSWTFNTPGTYEFYVAIQGCDEYSSAYEPSPYTVTVTKREAQSIHSQNAIIRPGNTFVPAYLGYSGTGAISFTTQEAINNCPDPNWYHNLDTHYSDNNLGPVPPMLQLIAEGKSGIPTYTSLTFQEPGTHQFYVMIHGDSQYTTAYNGPYTLAVSPPKNQTISSENATVLVGASFTPAYHDYLGTGQLSFTSQEILNHDQFAEWHFAYEHNDQPIPSIPQGLIDGKNIMPRVTTWRFEHPGTYQFHVAIQKDDDYNAAAAGPYTVTVVEPQAQSIHSQDTSIRPGHAFVPAYLGYSGTGALSFTTQEAINHYTNYVDPEWYNHHENEHAALIAEGGTNIPIYTEMTFENIGTHRFYVMIQSDSRYSAAANGPYTLKVQLLNDQKPSPPTISGSRISMAGCIEPNHYTYTGDSIGIRVAGHSEDNNIAKIDWYIRTPDGDTPTATSGAASHNDSDIVTTHATILANGPGTYTIMAQATDNRGATSGWVEIYSITVQDPTETIVITSRALPNPGFENWLLPSDQTSMIYTIQKPRGPIFP